MATLNLSVTVKLPVAGEGMSAQRLSVNGRGSTQPPSPQLSFRSGRRKVRRGKVMPTVVATSINDQGKEVSLLCLLDTGTTGSIALARRVPHRCLSDKTITEWATKSGTFYTNGKGMVRLTLPEFSTKPVFEFPCHIYDNPEADKDRYDMILGTSFLKQYGFSLDFATSTIASGDATIPI